MVAAIVRHHAGTATAAVVGCGIALACAAAATIRRHDDGRSAWALVALAYAIVAGAITSDARWVALSAVGAAAAWVAGTARAIANRDEHRALGLEARLGPLLLLGVAALSDIRSTGHWSTFTIVAVVLSGVLATFGHRLEPFIHCLVEGIRHVIGWVGNLAFALLLTPILVVVWVRDRVFHITRISEPGWNHGLPSRLPATSPGATGVSLVQRRRRRIGAAVCAVVIVASLLGWGAVNAQRDYDNSWAAAMPAFKGAKWWPLLDRETHWAMFDPGPVFSPLRFPVQKDVKGKYLNITNGYRHTWKHPACGCRPLRVWVYGGSTAFGMGQRDDHTIASEFSRLGWADGVALDVSNRGILGDTSWMELQRFQWEIQTETPPDLVIFYDGYNDLAAANYRIERRTGSFAQYPVDWKGESVFQPSAQLEWGKDLTAPDRPDTLRVSDSAGATRTPGHATAATTEWYSATIGLARTAARAHGATIAFFWQPVPSTSPVATRPTSSTTTKTFAAQYRDLRRTLPANATDLADVFDGVSQPVFYDQVHTNELGSRLVATAMYSHLKGDIRALAAKANPGTPRAPVPR